ncbi:hypothetical protein Q1695_000257 [Nippostrongylus brasiliensis]|nr:hypothetical protein Q1695_000257 [Nippostrongylus brasiliensis]
MKRLLSAQVQNIYFTQKQTPLGELKETSNQNEIGSEERRQKLMADESMCAKEIKQMRRGILEDAKKPFAFNIHDAKTTKGV